MTQEEIAQLKAQLREVLGSDFFASYNIYQGLHQRGFVHLLRDGHDLKEHIPAIRRCCTGSANLKP